MGKLEKLKEFKEKISYSIQTNIFLTIMAILLTFVFVFEIFSFQALRDYNYNNVVSYMSSQARYSADLYQTYASDSTLSDNVLKEKFQFIKDTEGQIQIIDNNETVLYDSVASNDIGTKISSSDVESALQGKESFIVQRSAKTNEKIMSFSYPLRDSQNQVGIIRINSSLKNLDSQVTRKFSFFIIFGVTAIILGAIASLYYSKKLVKPITKLTDVALKLSDGQYENRTNIEYKGEVGELARTLDTMSENIVKKEILKTDFISSVSHELRTPLTSIKGWSLTLQDDDIDKDLVIDGLKIIEQEAERLTGMVEDLLDFSRFTSPGFNINKTKFDYLVIAKNIINQLKPRSKEKNIDLLLNYNSESIPVIADEDRMKQVLINLLDNAIKFTPIDGTIWLNIIKETDELRVEVIDTGIGISKDEIDLVTTKFYKGSSSESHTGLGLSICEEIIKAHNGTLTIESTEGEGSTFSFTIPMKEEV